ncbi:hypothetical protein HDU93_007735 [Gonapodya sp. JEL0774]|nr:hypothetical protein HDU93_007735 [Gonapodya sp. JEL0774]
MVVEETSKYCSERCGIDVAKKVLEEGRRTLVREEVKRRVAKEKEDIEEEYLRKIEEAGLVRSKFAWLDGNGVPLESEHGEDTFGEEEDGKWTTKLDDKDLAELRVIKNKKDTCKRLGSEAMERFELFADYVLKVHDHNENLVATNFYPMCGFDQTVISILDGTVSFADGSYEARFVNPDAAKFAATAAVTLVPIEGAHGETNEDEDQSNDANGHVESAPTPLFPVPYTACRFPPTRCPRHVGWETLKREELELVVTNLADELEDLREEETEVLARIGKRAWDVGECSAGMRDGDGLRRGEMREIEAEVEVVRVVTVKIEERKRGKKKIGVVPR